MEDEQKQQAAWLDIENRDNAASPAVVMNLRRLESRALWTLAIGAFIAFVSYIVLAGYVVWKGLFG